MSDTNEAGDVALAPETALEQAIETRAEEIAAVDIAAAEAHAASARAEVAHIQEHAAAVVAATEQRIEQSEEQVRWRTIQAELSQLREQNHNHLTLLQTQQGMMQAFSEPLLELIKILREEVEASSKSIPPVSRDPALVPGALIPEAPADADPDREASAKPKRKHRLI